MKKIYLVEYNDRYGNGDNKSFEGYVESREDFMKWLVEHNKEREAEGELEEGKEEFTLHLLDKLM
jgi:hypothetical protein